MSNSNTDKTRVVVTGLGVVSSLGIGWQEFWKNLLAGKSGISEADLFDTSKHSRHLAAEIKNFPLHDFIPRKQAATMGRTSHFAIAAVNLALKDAKMASSASTSKKIGLYLGTTMGESRVIESIADQNVGIETHQLKKIQAVTYPAESITFNVAKILKLSGPTLVIANACAAGNFAIAYAAEQIKAGRAKYMLAGGADSLSRIAFTGFSRLLAMAPEKCQPFDKNRQGMMLGEGAGILFLETLESARERGATIYAEIAGHGFSCDAKHMTNASVRGVASALKKTLKDAKLKPEQVDYVNAHGTGTQENDATECIALKRVMGENLKNIPVSSVKSMIGHSMGAASALEAITCCLAIKEGVMPPTINFSEKDPDCDIDCVPNEPRKKKIKYVLNNSQAFGGNNCCVVLRKQNE